VADIALPMPPVETRRPGPSSDVSNVKTREQAEAVAQQFERMFIAEMLRPMFEGIETDGEFGGGNAEATFDEYANAIAKGGGVGIADSVLKEILRMQGLE
jgi:peptidoglycan hydrolase FlgJ